MFDFFKKQSTNVDFEQFYSEKFEINNDIEFTDKTIKSARPVVMNGRINLPNCNFIGCDFVIVRVDVPIKNAICFSDPTFTNCEFVNCTFYFPSDVMHQLVAQKLISENSIISESFDTIPVTKMLN